MSTVAVPHEEVGLGRAFMKGSIVGFVGVFVLFGGVAYAYGLGAGPSFGVGVFTGMWGGPGFGGMMGAVLHHTRATQRLAASAPAASALAASAPVSTHASNESFDREAATSAHTSQRPAVVVAGVERAAPTPPVVRTPDLVQGSAT